MGLFGKKKTTNPISKVKLLGMRTAQQTMTFSTVNFSIYSFWVVYENGATKTIEVSPENPMDKSGKEKALFDKLMSYANDELSGNSGTQSAVSSADMLDELKKLKELFGIETLMLGGGGVLNWSFIQAGMCDEVSIVIAAAADGSNDTPSLFSVREGLSSYKAISFELQSAEVKDRGSVWLRYKVRPEKGV